MEWSGVKIQCSELLAHVDSTSYKIGQLLLTEAFSVLIVYSIGKVVKGVEILEYMSDSPLTVIFIESPIPKSKREGMVVDGDPFCPTLNDMLRL